jgi:hypothetical protein
MNSVTYTRPDNHAELPKLRDLIQGRRQMNFCVAQLSYLVVFEELKTRINKEIKTYSQDDVMIDCVLNSYMDMMYTASVAPSLAEKTAILRKHLTMMRKLQD